MHCPKFQSSCAWLLCRLPTGLFTERNSSSISTGFWSDKSCLFDCFCAEDLVTLCVAGASVVQLIATWQHGAPRRHLARDCIAVNSVDSILMILCAFVCVCFTIACLAYGVSVSLS